MYDFMEDVRISIEAIKAVTGSERVNFAILGNRESHVHAHLIPRYPLVEEFPDCSPWNDTRVKGLLDKDKKEKFLSDVAVYFKNMIAVG